jgi:uncharacterized surface protein with fasciclin (FAS1) repeats
MSTILQLTYADKNLTILTTGLKATELDTTLNGIGPFTIFAPINLAFGKLATPDTFENIVKQSKDNSKLSELLTFHVIKGKKMIKDFRDGQKLQTVNGQELIVTVKDGEIRVNGAKILSKDRQASNGVVHSIDAVNVPVI